ncbi:hypothetical protein MMC17_004891 [Xylographa soralifera]|nr:hypothetical protein [Xylographa soralifera]
MALVEPRTLHDGSADPVSLDTAQPQAVDSATDFQSSPNKLPPKESSANLAASLANSKIAPTMGEGVLITSNGVSSQPTESNGVTTGTDSFSSLLETNGVHTEISTATSLNASESLKLSAPDDPAVQQPISDIREAIEYGDLSTAQQDDEREVTPIVNAEPNVANGVSDPADLEGDLDMISAPDPLSVAEDNMESSSGLDTTVHIENVDLPHHPTVPSIEGRSQEAPLDPPATPVTEESQATTRVDTLEPGTNSDVQTSTDDQVMQDAPPSPRKAARSRDEDDDEDEPATKRLRAEDSGSQAPEFKVPDLPQTISEHAPSITPQTADQASTTSMQTQSLTNKGSSAPITRPQHKVLLKGIQNLRRTNNANAFNQPVDHVLLKIPTYPDIVKNPMDLRTMEEKLKNEAYASVDVYVSDFNQIVENSVLFNGSEHPVTRIAYSLKASFDKQMANLPSPEVAETARPTKREKSVTAPNIPKVTTARRESRSSLGNPKTPVSASSPQTFALGPQGVPLIRRDSTALDGRPKREIHPPAPRDLPYSNQKPKKKKYLWELKFCQEVIDQMRKPKYQSVGWPFHNPVDPVALNIPTYHKIIKKPMDLSTVESKLKGGQYENAKEFESDIRLMFQNCYKFNPAGDNVHTMGKAFEGVFEAEWLHKKDWIDSHTPASGLQSPGTSPEPEDEDEEDEEDEEEEDEENEISILQKQIAAMSKQVELIQKKKSSPPVAVKKVSKGNKTAKVPPKKGGSALPAKSESKSSSKSIKKAKPPYVTYEQKQDISNRINMLNEKHMQQALNIIRKNMPNLKGVQEDEIELDIDELSNEVLYQVCNIEFEQYDSSDDEILQLLHFVRKHAPHPEDSPEPRQIAAPVAAAPSRPKKNKPMSKVEQEAKIDEIRSKLSGFRNAPSDESPEPYTQNQPAEDTSGDEDDSEESEED